MYPYTYKVNTKETGIKELILEKQQGEWKIIQIVKANKRTDRERTAKRKRGEKKKCQQQQK